MNKRGKLTVKQVKLYDMIFPIWLIVFFPPVIFISLAANYIIDSLVVIGCFFVYKISSKQQVSLITFYKKSIIKVWLLGFLADIIGAVILFVIGILGTSFGLPNDVSAGICFDPFSHPVSVVIITFAMLVSGLLIFLFNYNITFKKQIEEKKLKFKIALTIAIITIPWTFLLPTKLFYHGL